MNVQESLALPRARDTIGRITPYVPGKSIEEVAAEYGVRRREAGLNEIP